MLTIPGPRPQLCSGFGRRDFLQAGAAGFLGLSLPQLLKASTARPRNPAAKNCILLFLTGGPPQHDTWDMKPDAPAEIRGEFRPIRTTVPGLRVCELFPELAKRARHLCVVRSVEHADRTHTSAGYAMLTGVPHPDANAAGGGPRPTPNDHPHVGALAAKVRRPTPGVPAFVSLPEDIKDAAVNPFPGTDAGMLGAAYSPFRITADPKNTRLLPPDVALSAGMTAARLGSREALLGSLDRTLRRTEPAVGAMDVWYQKAFEVIRSPGFRRALDPDAEPPRVRERYGRHLFGQGCLMARRLVEAGVGLATVYWHYEGPDDSPVWDTHQNNFRHLRERLMPPTDQAVSALLDDLEVRGLLTDTLVVCMGEFGRSPRVNKDAGREHWAAAQSIVFAGAGVRAGSVYGATDRTGGTVVDKPVSPADVTATILHLLGVPADLEITDRTGRPLRACTGTPITGVLA